MYNRSLRRTDDAELFGAHLNNKYVDEIEAVDNFELRWERQHTDHVFFGVSGYYNIHDNVSWDRSSKEVRDIGELRTAGADLEIAYRTDRTRISLSHNFTKQLDFDLKRPTTMQNISASPYGYGNDLSNWSNHSSKLSITHDVNERWSLFGSAGIYWGYLGAQDYADYHQEVLAGGQKLPLYADGEERAFEESIFVNLGVEYRPTDSIAIGLHGYNLLGLIDEDLNKRNFFERTTEYRQEAASVALTARVRF